MSAVGISVITLVSVYICENVLMVASAALLAGIRTLNGVLRFRTCGASSGIGRSY
jgi:hypothetical protein